jgi:hypothetical protein
LGLEFTLDRTGRQITVSEHEELRTERWRTRGTYQVDRSDRPGDRRLVRLRQFQTLFAGLGLCLPLRRLNSMSNYHLLRSDAE